MRSKYLEIVAPLVIFMLPIVLGIVLFLKLRKERKWIGLVLIACPILLIAFLILVPHRDTLKSAKEWEARIEAEHYARYAKFKSGGLVRLSDARIFSPSYERMLMKIHGNLSDKSGELRITLDDCEDQLRHFIKVELNKDTSGPSIRGPVEILAKLERVISKVDGRYEPILHVQAIVPISELTDEDCK